MIRTTPVLSAIVLGALTVGLVGCSNGGMTAKDINKKIAREEAWRGTEYPVLNEVTYKGKVYALGSKKSADALTQNGTMPKMTTKAFAFGPNNETVIFEDNKLGMADILIEEYQAKHGKK